VVLKVTVKKYGAEWGTGWLTYVTFLPQQHERQRECVRFARFHSLRYVRYFLKKSTSHPNMIPWRRYWRRQDMPCSAWAGGLCQLGEGFTLMIG
jgi:hypothetical protein